MDLVQVSGISRKEGEGFAIRDVSFVQPPFWKIGIVGATGSGKTTLLKMIAGLLQPTSGTVLLQGKRVKGPEETLLPGHPEIAYLSQYFELRHHHRVEDILEKANNLSAEEASIIYRACRVDHLLSRKEDQLSGGEKQRIALARLLVAAPILLLLDEPFSNLDTHHKNVLKSVIRELSDTLEISCIIVSHDPLDILSWADEIIVLKDGSIVQRGTPLEVYKRPVDEYTAALFGKYSVLGPSLAKAFSMITDIEMNRINSFIRPEAFSIVNNEQEGVRG
ncbi:MAG TPA: ABC transporter ATP-binding protein, partial [Chitinophagaceae bacterium]|nr:ABC transporter ATP-binding protein [Chitinophagaceae bacterium]